MQRINIEGIELIKHFEGLSLKPYHCSGNAYTIGYGHVIQPFEEFVEITEEKAEELLQGDIMAAEAVVDELVDAPLTSNQFAALVSFVFNLGAGNFKSSTLLRKLNENKYLEIPQEFIRWIYTGKIPMKGLLRRRLAEALLFMS